jgi:hypothetical protein
VIGGVIGGARSVPRARPGPGTSHPARVIHGCDLAGRGATLGVGQPDRAWRTNGWCEMPAMTQLAVTRVKFGDHPEVAARRMHWVRQFTAQATDQP